MAQSSIEWTEMTWNPVTGCTKISEGCRNCYAATFTRRLKAMGVKKYSDGFNVNVHPDSLHEPYTWKKPKVVFVNSMSDLFHEKVPIEFIQQVFQVMKDNPQHVFQILTKRADVLLYYDKEELLNWTHNIWMGVSVENDWNKHRIDLLSQTGARTKFLSCEPLIGPIGKMNLKNIDWVIVGGESGLKARPMEKEWVIEIKDQCIENDVSFFFKQWGGKNKKKAGRVLDGKTWDEMPSIESVK